MAQTSGTTTRCTQDLACPLSQILSDGTSQFIYGTERLAQVSGSTRTWYAADALGSVRRTVINTGVTTSLPSLVFRLRSLRPGFTGELQQSNNSYQRAVVQCGHQKRKRLYSMHMMLVSMLSGLLGAIVVGRT